jgi:hypothetical protein
VAAGRAPPAQRAVRAVAALRVLPLAVAVARTGCIVAGCCGGRTLVLGAGALTWPVPWIEAALFVALARALIGQPAARAGPRFCVGFGAVRLLVEPLRAAPALGTPVLSPAWLALAWIGLGLLWGRAPRTR